MIEREIRLSVRDVITIVVLMVSLTSSYFLGQAQAERTARTIAREEVADAIGKELPVMTYRMGEMEKAIKTLAEKVGSLDSAFRQ